MFIIRTIGLEGRHSSSVRSDNGKSYQIHSTYNEFAESVTMVLSELSCKIDLHLCGFFLMFVEVC